MILSIKGAFATALLFFLVFLPQNEVNSSPESEVIFKWANKFGEELWELAQTMTKAQDIFHRYKSFNARVNEKDGEQLISEIVDTIGVMLNRKMDATKCIVKKAEEYAEYYHNNDFNYTGRNVFYPSSKFSPITEYQLNFTNRHSYENNVEESLGNYTTMILDDDSHFYDLPVNTNYSSVHVPTNVDEFNREGVEFIEWSEELDTVFKQNYNADPALSWQYFGSNLGIMRHYPALSWNRNETDTYDCRKRSWYIETATCSKDVVIVMDNSGSMHGYRNYVAQLTIKSLLDTFSNNDFFNIITTNNAFRNYLVPCFEGKLVQATPENINKFKDQIHDVASANKSDPILGMEVAFQLLAEYRELRNCSGSKAGCNQAIMLVTDGVPDGPGANETFRQYNWNVYENKSQPVRVFTYLLGQEVTNVREIQNYACANRGCYSHIRTLDEVADEVLKYVNVIAAPLVLQRDLHPPTWTHAYLDETHLTDIRKSEDDTSDFRMMIAVGVPAFNLSSYGDRNSSKKQMPTLLGVAGTDVPVEDIVKLALPYKLGVNGYAFVVSNNGYVLLHPDLRPIDKTHNKVKENYNSIDIVEIEQIDDNSPPRTLSDKLLELRSHLVNYTVGKMENVTVKLHYDDRRRVEKRMQTYYFAPIPHTPFSLGIALPNGYGTTLIRVGDEIQRNNYTKVNISDFFVGDNWKIHPDWVYCRYHYKEDHEFKDMEDELRVFLKKMVEPGWKWSQQYEKDEDSDIEKDIDDVNCGRKSFDNDAYYCNKELVELLVFDAKVTNESYQSWTFKNEREREIVEMYNATVRYVSTMSGLTRWQFIFGEVEVAGDHEFGDDYSKAIEEPWYQNAIFQHEIDHHSFVYSVKHDEELKKDREEHKNEDQELLVSASMAIFPRDGGKEAPSCVVGFQFSHELMQARFAEITENVECEGCTIQSCAEETQSCYVIDNNGYIILSEEKSNRTGYFFGEFEQPTMQSMVDIGIYEKVVVYDYQGLCYERRCGGDGSAGVGLMTPLKFLMLTFKWIITEVFVEFSRLKYWAQGIPVDFSRKKKINSDNQDYDDDGDGDELSGGRRTTPKPDTTTKFLSIEDWDEATWRNYTKHKPPECEDEFWPCDKKSELFVLQQKFRFKDRYEDLRSRPYFVNMIPHSNMLLVVIDKTNQPANEIFPVMTTDPIEMEKEETYGAEHPCHKLYMENLDRRRIDECYTEHEDEGTDHLKYCSSSTRIKYTLSLILLPMFYLMRFA